VLNGCPALCGPRSAAPIMARRRPLPAKGGAGKSRKVMRTTYLMGLSAVIGLGVAYRVGWTHGRRALSSGSTADARGRAYEARRLAQEGDASPAAIASLTEWLGDPEVQAVYIPLPNTLHREWTLRCAAAGKHVLCEKPLATSAAECEEMIAGCRRHGVVLMEAFMYRFHPRTERVLQMAAEGAVGELRLVRASFTFPASDPRTNIRFRPDLGGGALYDVGCYATNLCRAVLGEPEHVMAFGSIGPSGVDEVAAGVLRFPNGRLGVIDCSLTLPGRQEYEIVGSTGRLTVPAPNAFVAGMTDAQIDALLQAAMAAPSASDKRPWSFVVVREAARACLRKRISGVICVRARRSSSRCWAIPARPITGSLIAVRQRRIFCSPRRGSIWARCGLPFIRARRAKQPLATC
jgi:xylose dehydrogenase (NAD/NADP)